MESEVNSTKIHVTEANINDGLIERHRSSVGSKKAGFKLPKILTPRFKKPNFKSSPLVVVSIVVILVVLSGAVGYKKYSALQAENKRLANPQAVADDETNKLINKVAQLVELPSEKPTIATVTDASKLKNQVFFSNVQNGDRVLFFPNAKRAILYRPSSNKIIEAMALNIGNSGVSGATTTTPTTPAPTQKR